MRYDAPAGERLFLDSTFLPRPEFHSLLSPNSRNAPRSSAPVQFRLQRVERHAAGLAESRSTFLELPLSFFFFRDPLFSRVAPA
mmetsp:Transcript_18894/g.59363  ORF Transcript_18894/g.59363 Transcript_18894/m.59363 type:complete len:84 (-) Transcript_18894:99-350(-)